MTAIVYELASLLSKVKLAIQVVVHEHTDKRKQFWRVRSRLQRMNHVDCYMHTLILHPCKVLVFLGNGTRSLDISVERTHKQAFDTRTTCHLVIALDDRRLLISHVLYLHVELKRHARCRSIDEVLPRLVWYGERLTCHDTQYLHTIII